MMIYQMTSQDLKTEFHPFQDVFVSNSREEISVSEILERWSLSFRGKPFENPFSPILNLPLQIDYSSSVFPFLESKSSETALTEEFVRKMEQMKVLENVSRICDKLTLEESSFRSIDKTKLLRTISEILSEIPSEQFNIPEEELYKRIRGVLVLEAVSGTLNELTPEQIKDFDEAVKRRPFFK